MYDLTLSPDSVLAFNAAVKAFQIAATEDIFPAASAMRFISPLIKLEPILDSKGESTGLGRFVPTISDSRVVEVEDDVFRHLEKSLLAAISGKKKDGTSIFCGEDAIMLEAAMKSIKSAEKKAPKIIEGGKKKG